MICGTLAHRNSVTDLPRVDSRKAAAGPSPRGGAFASESVWYRPGFGALKSAGSRRTVEASHASRGVVLDRSRCSRPSPSPRSRQQQSGSSAKPRKQKELKRLSLSPLSMEEALRAAIATGPITDSGLRSHKKREKQT